MSEEFKECPFCSEQIKSSAKKCKHCGEILDVALRATEESKNNSNPTVFMNAGGGAVSSSVKEETEETGIFSDIVELKNDMGQVKRLKTGFSWKALFFGILVPFFQGEFMYGLKWILGSFLILPIFIMPFKYNTWLIKRYVNNGYKPTNKAIQNYLASKGIAADVIR